jgi:cysteine desulfurase/selenocysteine lyase
MPPWQGGGEMIRSVTFEKTTYKGIPARFEAGTPPIAGAIGLAAAIEYIESVGMDRIEAYERDLLAYGTKMLDEIDGLRIVGRAREKVAVLSFVMDCAHPHDIAQVLDDEGIAIRAGHHCAQPVMERLGIAATARASLALYNTREELDALAAAIEKVKAVFA